MRRFLEGVDLLLDSGALEKGPHFPFPALFHPFPPRLVFSVGDIIANPCPFAFREEGDSPEV
jgi:hypothetical protein